MLETIICSILLVIAVALIVFVLLQQGKSHNLSGTISGGAETFFGKSKGRKMDAMLGKITTALAIVFASLVIFVYVLQPDYSPDIKAPDFNSWAGLSPNYSEPEEETTAPETAAPETDAPETNAPETNAPETTAGD